MLKITIKSAKTFVINNGSEIVRLEDVNDLEITLPNNNLSILCQNKPFNPVHFTPKTKKNNTKEKIKSDRDGSKSPPIHKKAAVSAYDGHICNSDCVDTIICINGFPNDITEEDVTNVAERYGYVRKVYQLPPTGDMTSVSYKVCYEDARDAEDAMYGIDGIEFRGNELKVIKV